MKSNLIESNLMKSNLMESNLRTLYDSIQFERILYNIIQICIIQLNIIQFHRNKFHVIQLNPIQLYRVKIKAIQFLRIQSDLKFHTAIQDALFNAHEVVVAEIELPEELQVLELPGAEHGVEVVAQQVVAEQDDLEGVLHSVEQPLRQPPDLPSMLNNVFFSWSITARQNKLECSWQDCSFVANICLEPTLELHSSLV